MSFNPDISKQVLEVIFSKKDVNFPLGLDSLKSRRTGRHLWAFHKIVSTRFPTYLLNLIHQSTHGYQSRTSIAIPTYHQCRTDTFKHYLFFLGLFFLEWNKIHPYIRNASVTVLKKHLLKGIRPDPQPVYNVCKPIGLKLLTRLRLRLSHLNESKFNHNFENCVNPLCGCSLEYCTKNKVFRVGFFQ